MHPEILTPEQVAILPMISSFSDSFGLAGGTAIALWIGHRQSLDFDLFTDREFKNTDLIKKVNQTGNRIERILVNRRGELTFFTNGIKVTFLEFPFSVPFGEKFKETIPMADLLTLSATKAFALGQRNKWKDYVDLYFIIKDHYPLSEITKRAGELFGESFNEKIFRSQLAYFNDIDFSEEVFYLKDFETSEEVIKKALVEFSLVEG